MAEHDGGASNVGGVEAGLVTPDGSSPSSPGVTPHVARATYLPPAKSYRPKSDTDLQLQHLRRIEDGLFERSARVLDGALRAMEVDVDATEPPKEWVEEMGEKGAREALKAARDIQVPPAARPGYIALAQSTLAGISKSREGRSLAGAKPLNVNIVVAVSPSVMPELVVEDVSDDQ